MEIISNRIIFLNILREDKFFEELGKKYKGRFYKKLKNSFGWSFPIEFKDPIELEYKNYTPKDNDSSSDSETSSIAINENSEKETESETTSYSTHTDKISGYESDSDSESSFEIVKENKSTQTEINNVYRYNLPNIIHEKFNIYRDLI